MTYAILLGGIFIGLPIAFAIIAALLYFMAVGEFPYHLRIVATQMFGARKPGQTELSEWQTLLTELEHS